MSDYDTLIARVRTSNDPYQALHQFIEGTAMQLKNAGRDTDKIAAVGAALSNAAEICDAVFEGTPAEQPRNRGPIPPHEQVRTPTPGPGTEPPRPPASSFHRDAARDEPGPYPTDANPAPRGPLNKRPDGTDIHDHDADGNPRTGADNRSTPGRGPLNRRP